LPGYPPPWWRRRRRTNHVLRAADRAYLLRDGQRIAEGAVGEVLTLDQLQALYRAPVETLSDPASGRTSFLPG